MGKSETCNSINSLEYFYLRSYLLIKNNFLLESLILAICINGCHLFSVKSLPNVVQRG